MILDPLLQEIPLGVECAWPMPAPGRLAAPSPRQRRLADAWRRLKAVFQPTSRSSWAR